MFNFAVCQLEISAFFGAAHSDDSLPWSGDGAGATCRTCCASSGRTLRTCLETAWLDDAADHPLLSLSLQMVRTKTAVRQSRGLRVGHVSRRVGLRGSDGAAVLHTSGQATADCNPAIVTSPVLVFSRIGPCNGRVGPPGSDKAAVLHGEVRRVTGSTHSTSARELRRRPHSLQASLKLEILSMRRRTDDAWAPRSLQRRATGSMRVSGTLPPCFPTTATCSALRPPNFCRASSLMRALHVLKRTRRLLMD